jgi:hypothetical protein
MFQFIVGSIIGGLAVYFWRDQIRGYVDQNLPNVGERAAEKLEALEKGTGEVLDRAKAQIGENLRAGQQRLRSIGGQGRRGETDAP